MTMTNTKDWFDKLKRGSVVYWSTNQLPFQFLGSADRPAASYARTWFLIRNPRTGREFPVPMGSLSEQPRPKDSGRGQQTRRRVDASK